MKLHFDNVKTNKFSNMGDLHRSLSNEERESIQVSVKNTYQEFITHVAHARNMNTEEVDLIGQGRVWTGIRAKEIGLVDSIGGLSDAIELASQLAEINDFQIEEFPKTNNGIEAFFKSIEETKHLSNQRIDAIYLDKIKKELLNMQGIQALLPIKYELK